MSPLVVTSGNLSDEPIARTNDEASIRLSGLADSFLLHNRDIHVVCDDSVVRCLNDQLLPIRRSRGYAPMPIPLGEGGPNVLAVGGELKATFCVTRDNYAFISQHIGDVGNIETLRALERNVEHFLKLFRIELEAVAGDLHPDYLSSQWGRRFAKGLGVPYQPVQHHFAHAVSLLAEKKRESMLACCFDGTGFGTDGAIWGGEFMASTTSSYERIGHLRYFPLPGGDASIKRPYRVALALLNSYGVDWDERLDCVATCPATERKVLRQQIDRNLNCVTTSSMGRLFDAIASLIGIRHRISYEAQAAMEMEALASEVIDDVDATDYRFELINAAKLEINCGGILKSILEDVFSGIDHRVIAAKFHHAVAKMICSVAVRNRTKTGVNCVGLTGGVFQNVLLTRLAERELKHHSFEVLTHTVVPPNDGGIALGQAMVAQKKSLRSTA